MTEADLAGITHTQRVRKTGVSPGWEHKTHLLISLRRNTHICKHMHAADTATRSANLLLKCYSEFLLLNHFSAID